MISTESDAAHWAAAVSRSAVWPEGTAFAGNNRLKLLSVWNNTGITDASVPTLSTMTGLRDLDIDTSITAKGYDAVSKALPNCKVAKRKR